MAVIKTITPFSTAARYADKLLSWMDDYDAQRIAAYQAYEDMYWGQLNTFAVTALGDDGNPIVMPVTRSFIEAINRYLAVDWDIFLDPAAGTPEERNAAYVTFKRLFRRENMAAKFIEQKRYGLIKGDAIWHITADPLKADGTKISIHTVDPASYFPIYDDESFDRLVGVYLVDVIVDDANKQIVRRQMYRRVQDEATGQFTGEILSGLATFELDGWDDRNKTDFEEKRIEDIVEEAVIPGITQLPVYRVPNMTNPGDPFGSSALRGLERLVEAISQGATDEDLAIALQGLGVYVTNAPHPTNENGEEVPWVIAPGNVVELGNVENIMFERVQGITSVEPSQDHLRYLENGMNKGGSVPAVALGDIDTQTAESGIALFLRLSPLLAANAERETEMLGIYDQMFYDLQTMWFPVFEGIEMPTVIVTSVVADPMPVNREAKIKEILDLATSVPPLLPLEMAIMELEKLGYQFPDGAAQMIMGQTARMAAANDPFAGRITAEEQSAATGTAAAGA